MPRGILDDGVSVAPRKRPREGSPRSPPRRGVADEFVGAERFSVEPDGSVGVGHGDLWRWPKKLLADGCHDAERFVPVITPTRCAAATMAVSRWASVVAAERPASVMR